MSVTFPKVQGIMVDEFDIHPDAVNPEAVLSKDLGMDSLDREEFAMTIEEEFEIHPPIKTSILSSLTNEKTTVKDWTDYLDTLK